MNTKQEVRQFSEAGINIVGELAKKFSELEGKTISAGEVFDRISKRMVTFNDVKEVIEGLTNEGGKFFDMQRKQADTLYGKMSNLRDAYEAMMNDIGRSNDTILKNGVDALRWLMANWEGVAKAVKLAVVAFATFKAGKIVSGVVSIWRQLSTLVDWMRLATASTKAFSTALSMIGKANLIVGAITLIGGAIWALREKSQNTIEVIDNLNDALANVEGPIKEINTLIDRYENLSNKTQRTKEETEELVNISKRLGRTYSDAVTGIDAETNALILNTQKLKENRDALIDAQKVKSSEAYETAKSRRTELSNQKENKLQSANRYRQALSEKVGPVSGLDRGKVEQTVKQLDVEIADLTILINDLDAAIAEYEKRLSHLNKISSDADPLAPWQKAYNQMLKTLGVSEQTIKRFDIDKEDYAMSDADVRKRIKDENDATNALLKSALDTRNALYDSANEDTKAALDAQVENLTAYQKEVVKVAKAFNVDLTDGKGSKKSPLVEQLEQELEAIKKIQSERAKLKSTTGDASGQDTVYSKIIGSFQQLKDLNVSSTYKEALEQARKILGSFSDSLEGKEELELKISLALSEYSVRDTKTKIQQAIENFESYTSAVDLYKDLIGKGMGERQALSIAFGENFDKDRNKVLDYVNSVLQAVNKSDVASINLGFDSKPIKEQLAGIWDSLSDEAKAALEKVERYRVTSIQAAASFNSKLGGLSSGYELGDSWTKDISKLVFSYSQAISKIGQEEAEMLDQLQSLRLTYTDEEYNNRDAAIRKHYENERNYQKQLAQEKLDGLANQVLNETLASEGLTPEMMQGWGDKTLEQVLQILSALSGISQELSIDDTVKQELDKLGLSIDDLAAAYKRLLNLKIENVTTEKFKKITQALEKGVNGFLKGLSNLADLFGALGGDMKNNISFLVDNMTQLLEGIDISGFAELYKQRREAKLQGADANGAEETTGIASALNTLGPYAQAASAAISVVTDIIQANKEANEAAARAAFEYAEALQEIERSARLAQYETIFGANELGKVVEGYIMAEEAMERVAQRLNYTTRIMGSNYAKSYKELYDAADKYKTMIGESFNPISFDRDSPYNPLDENSSYQIISDMRSGWQKLWGMDKNQIDLWKSDIYDEFGKIDVEKLTQWFDTYKDGLSEGHKQFVEGLINDLTVYQEGVTAIADYIRDIFGTLASDIADSMIEAFKQTGNAVADLETVFESLGETIIKSLLESLIIDKVLKDYETEVQGLYEQYARGEISEAELIAALGGLTDRILKDVEAVEDVTQNILDVADDKGLVGNTGNETPESLGGTIKGITESTAELLGSYLNAIRQTIAADSGRMGQVLASVSNISEVLNLYYPTCLDYLNRITAHNADISANTQKILKHLQGVLASDGLSIRVS